MKRACPSDRRHERRVRKCALSKLVCASTNEARRRSQIAKRKRLGFVILWLRRMILCVCALPIAEVAALMMIILLMLLLKVLHIFIFNYAHFRIVFVKL